MIGDTLRMARRFAPGSGARLALTVAALACGVALTCAIDLVNRAVLAAFVEVVDTMAGRAALQVTAIGVGPFSEDIAATVAAVADVALAVPHRLRILTTAERLDHFATQVPHAPVALVGGVTFAVCVLAAGAPARRAARLRTGGGAALRVSRMPTLRRIATAVPEHRPSAAETPAFLAGSAGVAARPPFEPGPPCKLGLRRWRAAGAGRRVTAAGGGA